MNAKRNQFTSLRSAGKATDPERLAKCLGDGKTAGTCKVKGEDLYEGTATTEKSFGGVRVPIGGTFRCKKSLFKSMAMVGGVYECLTDEAQELVDDFREVGNDGKVKASKPAGKKAAGKNADKGSGDEASSPDTFAQTKNGGKKVK